MVEKGSSPEASEAGQAAADRPELSLSVAEFRDRVPAEIRTVSFPVSVRGYRRQAVDAYVERVNLVIAELEVGRSPRSAVQHALDRVTGQVGGILAQAREAAEQITASAQEEAEESTARAKAEAAELVVDASAEADRTRMEARELLAQARGEAEAILSDSRAEADEILAQARAQAAEQLRRSEDELTALRERAEAQLQELQTDTDAVGEKRRQLLTDVHGLAAQLEELVSEASARFPRAEPEPEGAAMAASEAGTDAGASVVASPEGAAETIPAVGSPEGRAAEPVGNDTV